MTVAARAMAERKISVIAGRYASPILEPAKHDLAPVASPVMPLVIFDRGLGFLSPKDAGAYPPVLQRVSEPVGIIAAISEQPFDVRQAAKRAAADPSIGRDGRMNAKLEPCRGRR